MINFVRKHFKAFLCILGVGRVRNILIKVIIMLQIALKRLMLFSQLIFKQEAPYFNLFCTFFKIMTNFSIIL